MLPSVATALALGLLCGAAAWLGTLLVGSSGIPAWIFAASAAAIGICVGLRPVSPIELFVLIVAMLALTVCAASDLRARTLPDLFTLGPLVAIGILSIFERDWMPLLGAAFAFVPFAVLALLSRGRGMGWGDVKLAALGGALVGMPGITLAVIVAALGASVISLARHRFRQPIAFGPYLAASIGLSIALGGSA